MTKLSVLIIVTIAFLSDVSSQPNYYNSQARQNAEYRTLSNATKQAYSTPASSYKAPANQSSNNNSTSSGSSANSRTSGTGITNSGNNGYSNIGSGDKVRRQNEAGERNEARRLANEAIIASGEEQYRKLISRQGIAKTAADHYDLLLTGMRNGIDLRAVFKVIGRDLREYRAKWSGQPDQPFRPSDGRMEEAEYALKQLQDTTRIGGKTHLHEWVVKAFPTLQNYIQLADAALNENQYSTAISAYRTILEMKPGDFDAYAGLAAALAFSSRNKEAEEIFLRINGPSAGSEISVSLAWMQRLNGKNAEALQAAREAVTKDPEHPGALLVQAALTTNKEEADSLVKKAVGLLPELGNGSIAAMLLNMAKLLHKNQAYQESVLYLDLAVLAEPKNLDVLELRYGTNIEVGRSWEAKKDQETMSKL